MLEEGLLEEAKALYPLRELNALQTVGYKELFSYFDGEIDLESAVSEIKKNTRRYAKRQLTWFRRDPETVFFNPEEPSEIWDYLKERIKTSS
jgi:tRNA dimethylallyltransferase